MGYTLTKAKGRGDRRGEQGLRVVDIRFGARTKEWKDVHDSEEHGS